MDLARDTIFVTLAGSQAHGTAREGSDVDLRGVCVAPLALRLSLFTTFEQHEGVLDGELWEAIRPRLEAHPTAARALGIKVESVLYDIAKFLGLCANANPNALEILFADERDWAYETPAWRAIHAQRDRFLSRKVAQTYAGYAVAQLRKIQSHRAWLLDPPNEPTPAERGQPDASALKHWEAYQSWKAHRNTARADLERQHGYDTKHATHLVRLLRTGIELLETGELHVRRPDAEELNAIRDGALSFEALSTLAAELRRAMDEAAARTSLPADVDPAFVDQLLLETVLRR